MQAEMSADHATDGSLSACIHIDMDCPSAVAACIIDWKTSVAVLCLFMVRFLRKRHEQGEASWMMKKSVCHSNVDVLAVN